MWVPTSLLSLKLQIWRLLRARSSLTFRQTKESEFTLIPVRSSIISTIFTWSSYWYENLTPISCVAKNCHLSVFLKDFHNQLTLSYLIILQIHKKWAPSAPLRFRSRMWKLKSNNMELSSCGSASFNIQLQSRNDIK